ncbi:MAG: (2Fe-2S) ferredoxin domain-containing protein [Eubacteriaceae bacterium]|nr:(2Fe-2S) ferredoxin domain-containing protein [Eubacteriaceae bacterium]
MKKTSQQLQEIREATLAKITLKNDQTHRILVGLATCGQAAGARPVYDELKKIVTDKNLANVQVVQTGCIGLCRVEPIVEVLEKDGSKTTYINMTAEKIAKVVDEHIIGGKVVDEYTITVVDGTLISPKIIG